MKKIKRIPILFTIIIIVGIIITCIWGLNFSMPYSAHKEINIIIGQEFKNQDIYDITKEVIGNQPIRIQKVELYEDMVSISVKDITEEQIGNLNTKINEKYGIENKVEDILVTSTPNVRGRDLIKPYIMPVALSFLLILCYIVVYVMICNHTNKTINMLKAVIGTVEVILEFQLLYLALLAITRLPINALTVPFAIIIYILTTIGAMVHLGKQDEK